MQNRISCFLIKPTSNSKRLSVVQIRAEVIHSYISIQGFKKHIFPVISDYFTAQLPTGLVWMSNLKAETDIYCTLCPWILTFYVWPWNSVLHQAGGWPSKASLMSCTRRKHVCPHLSAPSYWLTMLKRFNLSCLFSHKFRFKLRKPVKTGF